MVMPRDLTIKIHVKWNITGTHKSHEASDRELFGYQRNRIGGGSDLSWNGDP